MKLIKNNLLEIGFCIFLFITIFLYNFYFSKYLSDLHHWGFINFSALDYINGGLLFKDIFVQYGTGQLILFKFINYFFSINFTNIGIIVTFFYYINLLLIFFILKKTSSRNISMLLVLLVYFVHPGIIFPWPDYIAGTFFLIFIFLQILEKKKYLDILSGLALFLCILFRTTYILHILLGIATYLVFYYLYLKKNNKKVLRSLFFFFIFLISYFIYLFLNNNFIDWFYHGIGVIKGYVYPSDSQTMNSYISSYGETIWLILKFAKMVLRFLQRLFFPANLSDFIFFIFFILNFIFILSLSNIKFLKIKLNVNNKFFLKNHHFLLIFLISFFGIIQSVFYFNFFKNINSCSGVLISSSFFIKLLLKKNFSIKKKHFSIFSFLILILFFSVFLKQLQPLFKIEKKNYFNSNIGYFGDRKFDMETLEYYKKAKNLVCNDKVKRIFNFTLDVSLTYICSMQTKFIHPYFYFLNNLNKSLFNDIQLQNFKKGDLIITYKGKNIDYSDFKNKDQYNFTKIKLPKAQIWWSSWHKDDSFYFVFKK